MTDRRAVPMSAVARRLARIVLRCALGAAAAILAGGIYAETHRAPGQP